MDRCSLLGGVAVCLGVNQKISLFNATGMLICAANKAGNQVEEAA